MSKKTKKRVSKYVPVKSTDTMKAAFQKAAADGEITTSDGQSVIVESKGIGKRVKDTRELAYSTIMEMTKNNYPYKKLFYRVVKERGWGKRNLIYIGKDKGGHSIEKLVKHPYNLFEASKPILKKVAVNGGEDLQSATMTLQFAWASRKTLNDLFKLILGD